MFAEGEKQLLFISGFPASRHLSITASQHPALPDNVLIQINCWQGLDTGCTPFHLYPSEHNNPSRKDAPLILRFPFKHLKKPSSTIGGP
jgi:hypothetical protein